MTEQTSWRHSVFGKRPARIANCSGYHGDPAEEMYNQATRGDIDFITGDYLAEINIAGNAEAFAAGQHTGYEETAWEGLRQSIDVIHTKQIKVAINGGALNPKGLALKVAELVKSKGYKLNVAYVTGDDLLPSVGESMPRTAEDAPPHLDSTNTNIRVTSESVLFTKDQTIELRTIVSANVYLGARAIYQGFKGGADIIICGRVADASPVIGAAWYWWSWDETDYDELAGALVAGHLIECSAYVTGGNFSGFDIAGELETFLEPGFPIAEVDRDGSCVITKHPGTAGIVTADTCKTQLLYELQGNVYLNSDVAACLDGIIVEEVGKDRVRVHGVTGSPPPSTTKLGIFYKGGYEVQLLFNATGYSCHEKFQLFEKQIRYRMSRESLKKLDIFEFQCIGVAADDPKDQNSSTVYFRIFAQSTDVEALKSIARAVGNISLRHYSGFHSSLDMRTAVPRPYLAYYPALWSQDELKESINFIHGNSEINSSPVGHPSKYEDLGARASYDTDKPQTFTGPTRRIRLGDIALARSGDKGANLNFGLFVQTRAQWDWLRSTFSRAEFARLLGDDMRPDFAIERVEFPEIFAVHFVVYGILGRGVSSAKRLDGFGKGFADYFRDKVFEVPVSVL